MVYVHRPNLTACRLAALIAVAYCTPGGATDDTSGGASTTTTSGSSEATSTGDGTTTTPTTTMPTTGTDGSSSSTGDPPDPAPICDDSACTLQCTQKQEIPLDDGSACLCAGPVDPPEGPPLTCSLPPLCGDPEFAEMMCVIQALRYGVVGSVAWQSQLEDVGGESTRIEILGPGLAQAVERGFVERACCDAVSRSFTSYVLPFTLAPPDAPEWQTCLDEIQQGDTQHDTDTLPACLRHTGLAVECSGEPLSECPAPPEPPAPDAACELTCPMMNDGVCDEATGTGLCRDGCDPADCTCAEDVPGPCDDVSADGPCPLGSDPDCEFS